MDQRTNLFLAGANIAAHWLFRELAPTLEPRVLRVAIPLDSLPPESEPVVEFHPQFTPQPCRDETFLNDLSALGRLDNSSRSAEGACQRISTAISRCAGADQFVHFCSYPVTVDKYLACVVLQLSKSAYDAVPRLLDIPHPYDHPVQFSLVEHAIQSYLSDCSGELQNPATQPLRGWKPYMEMLRSDGWALAAWAVAVIKEGPIVSDLFSACTALASTQYEKRDSIGSIIVSARKHPNVEPVLSLRESVPITELRTSRKLLQLSVAGLSLLFDGDGIYGAGKVAPGYDVQAKNLFIIKFTNPGTWALWHHEQPLMVVSNGNPRLPTPAFPEAEMRRHLSRLFGTLSHEVQVNLCNLAKAACDQKHGTTFIISSGAIQEAERLQHQCFRLSPLPLTPGLLPSLTDIDGAVLLDVDGICHAIGVILDGRVGVQGTIVGNRGRGARYNSAVRYAVDEKCPRCLIIVRSEDGMLNFIPEEETQATAGESVSS
jgi:Probable sensor domain DACNH/Probable sensor domain DACNG